MDYEIPRKVQQLGVDIQESQLKYHDRLVRVSKEFTFDSAHHLHNYEGKCKSLHGHTYKVQVVMIGRVDERGISIDFGDMKRIAKERVIDVLDHRYLNDVLPPMNTTAENMVVWIYERLLEGLKEEGWYPRVRMDMVRLWETPTSYAEVTRELMEDENEQ
ncbi:6-carboxytetrahydropterin synthase QueD [Paenibacillus turpanensis]|uniref:6-carboxytetrahydropterin synthase QueD n=1 Tax=Paenibacillus turpanensis TaxID=2689078 RepID=UPI001407EAD3|nr:6-carboxytetrahydropterin synthase QueD [Paenibacillus turpanensis]